MKNKSTFSTPTWNDGAHIQWYGERGIVNATVSFIASTHQYLEKTKSLLNVIVWANHGHLDWIEKIVDVRLIVEIGLAEFGNPDLMIVCKTEEDGWPYLVFVEAKARPYQFSARQNSLKMQRGYNSTINGQLTLKYRFAHALENAKSTDDRISEPEGNSKYYRNVLHDPLKHPRYLKKPAILATLRSLGIIGMPADNCYFVALTWDDGPDRVLKVDSDLLPVVLSDDDDTLKSKFGWLGYHELQGALDLDDHQEYANACHGMLHALRPSESDYQMKASLVDLPDEVAKTISEILDRLKQAFGDQACDVVAYSQSWSIRYNDIVVVKVIYNKTIFVGIKVPEGKSSVRERFSKIRYVRPTDFHGFELQPGADLSIHQDMADMIKEISRLYDKP